jgi:hypothetical protein
VLTSVEGEDIVREITAAGDHSPSRGMGNELGTYLHPSSKITCGTSKEFYSPTRVFRKRARFRGSKRESVLYYFKGYSSRPSTINTPMQRCN